MHKIHISKMHRVNSCDKQHACIFSCSVKGVLFL